MRAFGMLRLPHNCAVNLGRLSNSTLLQARSGRRCTASVYKAVHGGSQGVASCLDWLGRPGMGTELPPRPSTAPPSGGSSSPSRFLNFHDAVSNKPVARRSVAKSCGGMLQGHVPPCIPPHAHLCPCPCVCSRHTAQHPLASRREPSLSGAAARPPTCEFLLLQ